MKAHQKSGEPTLTDLMAAGEWEHAEFKAAHHGLPKSVFETISAFANTRGGWLLLGVSQQGEHFDITGVTEPDKLQNDLLSVLHADANPAIAMAPRRIEMCEQAGTGLRMIRREWQALGHAAPRHSNDRGRKSFELFLPDVESRAMAGMAPPVTPPVTPPVMALLTLLGQAGELGNAEIRMHLQLKDRTHLREQYLEPALTQGWVQYTRPDKPTSRLQKYRLTDAGRRLHAALPHIHKED